MNSPQARILRRARIISQGLFFGLFVYIFIKSLNPFSPGENPFLRFDLLIFLTHLQARLSFVLPTAGILILTIFIGRYFCGWVCPLGALIDLFDRFASPLRKINPYTGWKRRFRERWSKHPPSWFVLGTSLVAIFFTPPVLQFFHPNVWIVRIFSLSGLGLAFAGMLFLFSLFTRRFWCGYICPLGALYGLIGKISLFKLSIVECSRCGRCETCPMDAATFERKETGDMAGGSYRITDHMCILCFDYEERCPAEGFDFRRRMGLSRVKPLHALQPEGSGEGPEAVQGRAPLPVSGLSRREFLKGGAVFFGGLVLGSSLSASDRTVKTDLIRPPGVTDDTAFVKRCLRCFQCVRSCPNKIIKITRIETIFRPGAGFDSLFTPHIEFNEYGCDYNCQVCQQVCPNYAIPLQPLPVKQKTKMGLAAIDERLCVVFARDTNCLVCEEFCPTPDKAIKFVERKKVVNGEPILLRYPVVDVSLCIGCGKCEGNCPVQEKAIVVKKT